ncbi:MAG: hypothetical protein WDO69_08555 [Pseudomonadota bacterium]
MKPSIALLVGPGTDLRAAINAAKRSVTLGHDLAMAVDALGANIAGRDPLSDADGLAVSLYAVVLVLRTAHVESRNEERARPKPARLKGRMRICDLVSRGDIEALRQTEANLADALRGGTEPPWLVELLTITVTGLRALAGGAVL